MGTDPTGALAAIRRRPWVYLLGLLIILSTALLLVLRSKMGFFLDDWDLVSGREGSPTDWLLPHNEHIVVLPAAIYKLSLAVFGMTPMPLHVIAVLLFETSVVLLFLWMRPLVGEPSSVIGCAVILFLGAAAEDLLWAFQMGFFGSVAAGLGALLLLRHDEQRKDRWACLLLVVSILFSSMSIPFLAGAATQLLFRDGLRPDWRKFVRSSWIFLVPALLYAIWWLGWGHLAPNSISAHNLRQDPIYALSGLGYSGLVLSGAFRYLGPESTHDFWALTGLLFAGAIGLVAYIRRRVPIELVIALAAALSFWILSGLNYIPGREFFNSRYQYPGAVFLLMTLAGAFADIRPGRNLLVVMSALAVVAVTLNIAALLDGFNNTYRPYAERNAIALSALDISSRTVKPDFYIGVSDDGNAIITAESYLAASDKYGSAGLSDEGIDQAPAEQRVRLDQTLVGALPIRPLPAGNDGPVPGSWARPLPQTLMRPSRSKSRLPSFTSRLRGRTRSGWGALGPAWERWAGLPRPVSRPAT